MRTHFLFFWLLIGLPLLGMAQIPVGSWRDHLCYSNVIKVLKVDNKIYCATSLNLFIYNTADNSLQKLSTITGLSDVGISDIEYNKDKDILLISYTNGNLDLIHGNTITNIVDLKNKLISGVKGANYILFSGDYAYCCYDFGILVIDLLKNEIKDTYVIGGVGVVYPVNSLAIFDGYFYAATDNGIFKALVSDPYLVDYNRWIQQTSIPSPSRKFGSIITFNNQLVINSIGENSASDTLYRLNNLSWGKIQNIGYSGISGITATENNLVVTCTGYVYVFNQTFQKVYNYNRYSPQSALTDDTNIWIGDGSIGLIKQPLDGSDLSYYYPSGPASNFAWNMKVHNSNILVTAGGVNSAWNPISRAGLVYKFQDNTWSNIWGAGSDYIYICGDPSDATKFYVSSWANGAFVYQNNEQIENYTSQNSSIQNAYEDQSFIGGITFDSDENMWLTNDLVTSPISVRKKNGNWKSFNYPLLSNLNAIGDIVYDINGNFWVVLPRSAGMFAFNINKTIDDIDDDVSIRFKPKDVNSATISNVFCAVNDNDGSVWLGTENGPIVYTDPAGVFTGETDGYQPRIPRNDGTNLADALLGGESVYCIAVDGANRKWFGTEKGGAFLISADGTEQILHFTKENSPLFSNLVRCIAIQPKTGEVFFGTEKGIISYRGVATASEEDLSKAYAFPNPSRPDFQGDITISGLVESTSVKITDISGNLVYQTTSLGGSATWDGKNRKGNRASTGVYLIFLTNEDGTATKVIKLLMLR